MSVNIKQNGELVNLRGEYMIWIVYTKQSS